jgi:subtilisin family serine protease
MKRVIVNVFLILAMLLAFSATAFAQEGTPDRFEGRELPESVSALKLDSPVEMSGVLDDSLVGAKGEGKVIIRLSADSGAEAFAKGSATDKAKKAAEAQQAAFLKRVFAADPNAVVLGQVQMVLNAVFVEVDTAALPALAKDSAVVRIAPVADYEMDLSETVPYIGASAVQAAGFDGSGIKVAVLDSGVDYTHAKLGGGGTLADYEAAYGTDTSDPRNTTRDGLFPTAKVVEGYDFVGEEWPDGPLAPDPDPIDFEGHGTHVADIIGGYNGVAPGVDLYAVKVCSAVSTACSGVALINGMEFAVDPNGNGKVKDRVDVINMSLGSTYGQPFDDDLSAAVENATDLGVLTVSSAGNGADKPYVNGTPSSTASALSVAQTQVPSAALQLLDVDGVNYPAVFQPWSVPLSGVISAPVQYGDGAGGNLNGCASFAPGSLTGLIVLVDRGACNFTLKISNISQAGGEAGVIGLVAPGAPFSGGDGGDRPIDIPGYMISQADSNAIKAQIGNPGIGTFDPANQLPLIGQMVGSSSRGPQHESTQLIKPEIGAPGASVSAIAGSGTGEGPFGGTSGAAPMVSGSAALLLEAFGGTKTTGKGTPSGKALGHGLTPVEVKALLMNNGETDIDTDPFTGLAPITRIGGGEVRVDRAVGAPAAAWDADVPQGALSFGFVDVADDVVTLTKTVQVRNYSKEWRTYDIIPTFRFADDELNGAVSVSAPASVKLNPGLGSDAFFDVTLTIDGELLRGNFMNSGSAGADPSALTTNEYDGYLVLDDGEHPIHLAWHVLPRKDANVVPDTTDLIGGGFPEVIGLDNTGVGTAQNDAYALLAVSEDLPEGGLGELSPTPDIRAVGINTFRVPPFFCSAEESFIWAFTVNTWERQEHLVPVIVEVDLDIDQDGNFDYAVYNFDLSLSGSLSDGRQVTWAEDLVNGGASAFFFAEHSMNTGNTVLYICGEQVGLTGTDMLTTNVDMEVYTDDWYNGGPGDSVTGLTVTPLGEQYFGVANDLPGNTYDPNGLSVFDFGPFPGNSPELGVMLLTNGDRGTGASGGATQDTEALLFTVP